MKKMQFLSNFRLLSATLLLALLLGLFPSVAAASATLGYLSDFNTLMGVNFGLGNPAPQLENTGYGTSEPPTIVSFSGFPLTSGLDAVTPTIKQNLINYDVKGYTGKVQVKSTADISGYKLAIPFTLTISETSAAKGVTLGDALRIYYSPNEEGLENRSLSLLLPNTKPTDNDDLETGKYYVFADAGMINKPTDERTFLPANTPLEPKEYKGFFVTEAAENITVDKSADVPVNLVLAFLNETDKQGIAPVEQQGTPAFSYESFLTMLSFDDTTNNEFPTTPPPGFFARQWFTLESAGVIGKASEPASPYANDRIVLQWTFTPGLLTAENPTFTKDFKLVAIEGENITDYVFVKDAETAMNAENRDTPNYWVEGLAGDAISEEQRYTIYYEATTDNEGKLNSKVYFLTTEALTNNGAREYVSEFVQADPAFSLPADYKTLYINTDNGASENMSPTDLRPPYAFVNQRSKFGSNGPYGGDSILTITTVPDSFFAAPADDDPKFVTYAIQVITLSTNEVNGSPQSLNDLTTADVIVRKYDLTTGLPAGDYTFVSEKPTTLTEPIAWLAKRSEPSGYIPITTDNAPTKLDPYEDYIVYYTVPVDPVTKKATGNVAVLAKTMLFPEDVNDSFYSDFFLPSSNAYGQKGTEGTITITEEGAPFPQEFLGTNYRENQQAVAFANPDGMNSTSPIIGFELKGFNDQAAEGDLDAYIFTRKFNYNADSLAEGEDAPFINIENIQLEKWDNVDKAPEFRADFELAESYPPIGTELTRSEVQKLNGKYWLTATPPIIDPDTGLMADGEEVLVDVRAGTERFAPNTPYILYYVIQDNGNFDLNPEKGTIRDPNALYATTPRPGGSSSSGCSVSGKSAYDLALLALFALGFVVLRVRTRKG